MLSPPSGYSVVIGYQRFRGACHFCLHGEVKMVLSYRNNTRCHDPEDVDLKKATTFSVFYEFSFQKCKAELMEGEIVARLKLLYTRSSLLQNQKIRTQCQLSR
jgi:hypothetical protein